MPRAKTHLVLLQLNELNISESFLFLSLLILLILFKIFRMARICWFSNFVRAGLQKTCSVRHTDTKCQLCPSATLTRERFHTTCATSFRARPATASRVPAMDARCSLSTRGHWDGPVICNEMGKGICVSVVPHGILKLLLLLLLIDTIIANKEINGNNCNNICY